jgi:hypothetical protein
MRLLKVFLLGIVLVGLEGCYTYQLVLPLSTNTGRNIIAGRKKNSIELGVAAQRMVPVLKNDKIFFPFADTTQSVNNDFDGFSSVFVNYQLNPNFNMGLEYFSGDSHIDEVNNNNGREFGYIDFSLLYLTEPKPEMPFSFGILVKQSLSKTKIYEKYEDINYYGTGRGNSTTFFTFISTPSLTVFKPIQVQGQFGYLMANSMTSVNLMNNQIQYDITEAHSGGKVKGSLSLKDIMSVSWEGFIQNNGEIYVGLNATLVLNL